MLYGTPYCSEEEEAQATMFWRDKPYSVQISSLFPPCRWDAAHGSENDPVGSLPPHQLYWVIAMEDG